MHTNYPNGINVIEEWRNTINCDSLQQNTKSNWCITCFTNTTILDNSFVHVCHESFYLVLICFGSKKKRHVFCQKNNGSYILDNKYPLQTMNNQQELTNSYKNVCHRFNMYTKHIYFSNSTMNSCFALKWKSSVCTIKKCDELYGQKKCLKCLLIIFKVNVNEFKEFQMYYIYMHSKLAS